MTWTDDGNVTWTNVDNNDNGTSLGSNMTEDDALLFIGGRMTANPWSSTFQEVMICEDMFTAHDVGLNSSINETFMNLTLEDMELVGKACYNTRVSNSESSNCCAAVHLRINSKFYQYLF